MADRKSIDHEVKLLNEAGLVYVKYSCGCCVGLAAKGAATGLRLRREGEVGNFDACVPRPEEAPTPLAHEHAVDLHTQVADLLNDGLKYRRLRTMLGDMLGVKET